MYQTHTGEGHHAPHLPLCESSPSQALHCTHLESLREHLDDAGLRELLCDVRRMAHQKPQHTEGEGEGTGGEGGPSERGVRDGKAPAERGTLTGGEWGRDRGEGGTIREGGDGGGKCGPVCVYKLPSPSPPLPCTWPGVCAALAPSRCAACLHIPPCPLFPQTAPVQPRTWPGGCAAWAP